MILLDQCPHCGAAAFPHVRLADLPEECRALEQRYREASEEAENRGCGHLVRDLENALSRSEATIARSELETARMVSGDTQLYATFYQLIEAGVRVPEGNKWDLLRSQADTLLFGELYKKEIRFAALTLDGVGLSNYGDYSWIIKENMIANRSTVFEENSALFMYKVPKEKMFDLPRGFRAVFPRRAILGVAKLASRLAPENGTDCLPDLVLHQGDSSEDDDFIEVHIGGPMTIRTVSRIVATKVTSRSVFKNLQEQLEKFGVMLEDRE